MASAQPADPGPHAAYQRGDNPSSHQSQAAPAVSPVTIINSPPYPVRYGPNQELGAHLESNKPFWLQWEFWTALGTIGLAIGTIFLVLKTDAVIRSAEKTAQRQLRAYVFLGHIGLLDGSLAVPPNKALINRPGGYFTIKNSGQTPAYQAVHWAGVRVIPVQDQDTRLSIPDLQKGFRYTIAPSAEITATRRENLLTADEIAGLKDGSYALFAYGRVEYTDAFGARRWTNYRMHFTGEWPPTPSSSFMFSLGGNESDGDPQKNS